MERHTNDAPSPAWFIAADRAEHEDATEPDDRTPPNVIIAVSLDELDDMTGDMLV